MKKLTVIICFLALLAYILPGCSSSRKIDKSTSIVDSSYTHTLEKKIEELEKTVINYESQINEQQYNTISSDKKCDTIINEVVNQIIKSGCPKERVDSFLNALNAMRTKIKILSDGAIEAEGFLNSASVQKQRQEKIVATLQQEKSRLQTELDIAKAELKKLQSVKHKESETTVLDFWWMVVLGFAAATALFKGKIIVSFLRG